MQAWGEKPQRHGVVTGDIRFVPGGKAPAALSSTLTYAANFEYDSKLGTAASAKTPTGKAPAALTFVANYGYALKSSTRAPAGEASSVRRAPRRTTRPRFQASSSPHHAAALSLDVTPRHARAQGVPHGGSHRTVGVEL
jgi:hypothetical protein